MMKKIGGRKWMLAIIKNEKDLLRNKTVQVKSKKSVHEKNINFDLQFFAGSKFVVSFCTVIDASSLIEDNTV